MSFVSGRIFFLSIFSIDFSTKWERTCKTKILFRKKPNSFRNTIIDIVNSIENHLFFRNTKRNESFQTVIYTRNGHKRFTTLSGSFRENVTIIVLRSSLLLVTLKLNFLVSSNPNFMESFCIFFHFKFEYYLTRILIQ